MLLKIVLKTMKIFRFGIQWEHGVVMASKRFIMRVTNTINRQTEAQEGL